LQTVAQAGESGTHFGQVLCGVRCCTEAGDRRHILGAGARAPFLTATAKHRWNPRIGIARNQCTRTLRPTELVRRDGYKVGTARLKAERSATHYLHRIAVEYTIGGVDKIGDLPKRLNCAGLVVGGHDRDQRPAASLAVAGKHRFERREIEEAVAADRNEFDLTGGEAAAGAHSRMLDAG